MSIGIKRGKSEHGHYGQAFIDNYSDICQAVRDNLLKDIQRFIAFGAHCDDVDLRCGGTFSRLSREGKKGCYVVMVEDAYAGKHFPIKDSYEAIATRRKESGKASQIIGADRLEYFRFKSYYFGTKEPHSSVIPSFESFESLTKEMKGVIFQGLPPIANADLFPQCRQRAISLIEEYSPQAIFTHSPDDRHSDHYSASRFIYQIVYQMNLEENKGIDLYFWEPGGRGPIVGFFPNLFVELSPEDVERKHQALECYKSQFSPGQLKGWAKNRAVKYGKLGGVRYAEGFQEATFQERPYHWDIDKFKVFKNDDESVTVYPL